MARVIDAVLSLKDKFSPVLKQVSRNLQEQSKIHQRLGRDIESTGKSISSFGKATAFISAPLVAAAGAGFALTQSLDKSAARVGMLGQMTVEQAKVMKKGIIEVSNATGVASEKIADAMQNAISGGIKAGESMKFMGECIKYSKVSGMELNDVVNNTIAYTKAYNLTLDDTTRLNEQQIMTARLANVQMSAMSPALAGVAKSAADAGISIQQMDAAYVMMVRRGTDSNKAAGSLTSLFDSFSKISPKVADWAKNTYNLDTSLSHIKAIGFTNYLQEIQDKTGGNQVAIGKIIKDVEAFKLALKMTSGDGAGEYLNVLDQIQNSGGATAESLARLKTPAGETAKAMNQIKNAGIELVDGLQPLWTRSATMIKQVVSAFNSLTDEQKNMIFTAMKFIIVTTVMSGIIGQTVSIVGKGVTVFGNIGAGIEKAGSLAGYLATKFSTLISIVNKLSSAMTFVGGIFKGVLSGIGQAFINFGNSIAGVILHPLQTLVALRSGLMSVFGSLRSQMTSLANAIKNGVMAISRFILSGARNIATGFIQMLTNPLGALKAFGSNVVAVLRSIGMAARMLFMNPLGIAIMVVIGLAILIYMHWAQIKEFFVNTFKTISENAHNMIERMTSKFSGLYEKASGIFGRLVAIVMSAIAKISGSFSNGGSTIGRIINFIGSVLGASFTTALNLALVAVEGFVNVAVVVINGLLNVFSGVITFITGVFTGNWAMAWQGVVEIFSGIFSTIEGICNTVMGTIKAAINAVISGVNSVSVDVPEWVPVVGGQHYQPSIPMLAKGTDNWGGGLAMVHDAGPEIIDLPSGSRVYPHAKSMDMAREEGRKSVAGGDRKTEISITIPKLADVINTNSDTDIQKMIQALAFELKKFSINQTEGAV